MNYINQTYKGKNNWWIWIILITIGLYPQLKESYNYFFNLQSLQETYNFMQDYKGDRNILLIYTSSTYIFLVVLFLLVFSLLHKRKIASLFSKNIRYSKILFSCFTYGVVKMLIIGINYTMYPNDFLWNLNTDNLVNLVFITLLLLPFKIWFTELFYRGYILQGFSLCLKNRLLALIASSLVYTLMHSIGIEAEILGIRIVFINFFTALFLGIIVLMDEGLELVIGIQFIQLFITTVIVTYKYQFLQTDAILLNTSEPNILFIFYLPVFVFYPLYLLFLANTFNWSNWKEKLTSDVYKPPHIR